MQPLDWIVVGVYIALVIGMAAWIGRRQKSEDDYYLAGRRMGAWPLALSMIATQCSTVSLIGAPAFVALKTNGGLRWLQYELAVPLAAIGIILLLPIYFQRRVTTIYETIEYKFGPAARTTLSAIFLIARGLGTAAGLYAAALVTAVCLDWPLAGTIVLVGVVSLFYTTLGGIEADIWSDVLQLAVLYLGVIACIFVVLSLLGGMPTDLSVIGKDRLQVLDFSHHGLGDGETYAFWPMLFGGFFLYVSYYGCDQSQAQRLLSARDMQTAQKAVMINGMLRFPLVATYMFFGLLMAVWLNGNPDFRTLVTERGNPDYLVPMFLQTYVPAGIRGLIVAAVFAAAMSSLDSSMNSLSAATQRDFLERFAPRYKKLLFANDVTRARLLTIMWGLICTAAAFGFHGGAKTILEKINQVGSAFYGPILAVFVLALLPIRIVGGMVVFALLAGVGCNVLLWQFAPNVSWLWWNVTGCLVTLLLALLGAKKTGPQPTLPHSRAGWKGVVLLLAFVAIVAILATLNAMLR